jgi:type I restriction enzyme R subunit
VQKLITEEIPSRVAADSAYQNAKKNLDSQNARIEYGKALARVMTAVLKTTPSCSSSSWTTSRSGAG